jgi:ribosomal protein S18 acetylase RimI-like enzyme
MKHEIKIVDYRPEHQPYFESLNRAWIEKLFTMEPVDEFVLTDPEEAILKKGGAILMAEYNGVVAGTVGLRKVDVFTYEFTKMAVDENFRRLGIAEAICYASFKKARQLGARQVILYSNTLNTGAIKLYEKIGFKHVEVEQGVYKRANVKMIIDITSAVRAARLYDRHIQPAKIKIVEADVTHAAIIAAIGKKSFRYAFEEIFNSREELFEYLEFTYDPIKLTKSIRKENNVYLLAYADGKPVGFAKIKKHSLSDLIESPVQTELQKIYVLPEYRGNGAGSALMEEVKNITNEVNPDYLWLDVHTNNERAARFYEKNGFQKIGNYFFTIGSQTFKYYVMQMPVAKDYIYKNCGTDSTPQSLYGSPAC